MSKRLQGKKAFVTGGSRGIGAAIARRLAAEGADVAITFAGNQAAADATVAAAPAAQVGRWPRCWTAGVPPKTVESGVTASVFRSMATVSGVAPPDVRR